MLANGLRSHSVYNYAGYILSYIKIVYKSRNIIIPVEVKDECKLLIKATVCIEYCNIKEILILCNCNVAHSCYRGKDPDGAALN
jgi:hypothetical protein